jgi:hypothetical protein
MSHGFIILFYFLFLPYSTIFSSIKKLTYNSCTGGIHCDLHMSLQYILIRFIPSIILLYSSASFLRTISTGFIVLFSYLNIKYICYICLPYALLSPTGTCSRKDLFYLSVLHFCKVYINSTQGFALVFQTCTYHALIKPPPHYLLFLYHLTPILFNRLQCIVLYYLHCFVIL